MAEGADYFEFKATFSKAEASAQEFLDQLSKDIAIAKTTGDELWAAHLEAQKLALSGGAAAVPGRGVAGQGGDAGAIEKANTALRKQRDLDAEDLDLIKQQTQQRLEQLDLVERQAAAAKLILPPTGPQYGARGATAGGQIAAEEAAALQVQAAARKAALAGLGAGVDPALLAATRQGAFTPVTGVGRQYEDLAAQRSAVELAQQRAAAEAQVAAAIQLEIDRQAEAVAQDKERLRIEAQEAALINQQYSLAYKLGALGGAAGRRVAPEAVGLTQAPAGLRPEAWTAANAAAVRYNTTLGQYAALNARADLSNEALINNLTRVGVADAQASDQLRRHGALTTEFLGALARGETTVSEFGYQIGATIAKFAGWTAAAAATYGALGAVVEFAKGAFDASSAVQRLTRTIDGINPQEATAKIEQLSQDTNVSMKDAGNAVFVFSRTFHNLDEAVGAARLGLAAQKLDNVDLTDSVRASTAINQQYGGGLQNLTNVYNELSASQREYNARISDMIPLLQKSTGAVKNAGGDLTSLIQLGTYATRVTQLSGAQIGTALYRSAATFTNPATTKGQADLATLKALGVTTDQGYTELLRSAIERSFQANQNTRSQIALAVFGPQYGGRTSAIFNPQAEQTFRAITSGPRAITPADTRGSLQQELSRELGTVGEQAKAFVNAMQRLGAAFGESGVVQDFAIAIHVATLAMDQFRAVINIFDRLPGPVKEAVAAFTALRLAMLFFSRTRLGSTAPFITSVPGFRPSEATQLRSTLAIGGRQAIQAVQQDFAQTQAQITNQAAKQAELQSTKSRLDRAILASGRQDEAAIAESNAVGVQIQTAKDEQVRLQLLQNDQQGVLLQLQKQQVGLTAINRTARFTDPQVVALGGGVLPGAANANTAGAEAQVAATRTEEESLARNAAAKRLLAGVYVADTAAERAAAIAASEAALAATANTEATVVESGAIEEGTAATVGMGARLGGLAAALDPLTIGLIALPFVFSALSNAGDSTSAALDRANATIKKPIDTLAGLKARADALQTAADQLKKIEQGSGIGGVATALPRFFQGLLSNQQEQASSFAQGAAALYAPPSPAPARLEGGRFGRLVESSALEQQVRSAARVQATAADRAAARQLASTPQGRATEAKNLVAGYDRIAKQAEEDAKGVGDTVLSRERFYSQLRSLRAEAQRVAARNRGPDSAAALKIIDQKLQEVYAARQKDLSALADPSGGDPFKRFKGFTATQIEAQIKQLGDYVKVFGASGAQKEIQRAGQAYVYLANELAKQGHPATDTQLTNLAAAQQSLLATYKQAADDLVAQAASATTLGGQSTDLGKAYAAIESERRQVSRNLALILKEDAGNNVLIAHARRVAAQNRLQIDQQLGSVLSPQLQAISDAAAFQASQVTGISPEADTQRSAIVLQGLRKQLAKARAERAPASQQQTLQTQINSAQQQLYQTRESNARAIVQAAGQASASAITGISPEADIQRARVVLASYQRLLAFDEAHGAGVAQILQDQQQLSQQQQSLYQSIESNARSILQAQGQVSVSSITGISPQDDIARARKSVSNAAQLLAFDRSHGAGEAAILSDQAALYDQQRALNQALKSQDQQIAQDAAGLIAANAALAESQTLNPIKQAREELAASIKTLATIKPQDYQDRSQYLAALRNQRATINNNRAKLNDQIVQTDLSTLAFEYSINKIGDQQYINALERILRSKKLSLQERQQILQQIYQLKQGQGDSTFNTGNIKIPSVYEIRRAIGAGRQGTEPLGQNTVVNHTANVTVNVYGAKGADAVGRVLDQHLGTSVNSAMRAGGRT